MKKLPLLVHSFVCLVLLTASVSAETIRLKSGKTVEGTIVERTDQWIRVDVGLGTPITYYQEDLLPKKGSAGVASLRGDVPSEADAIGFDALRLIDAGQMEAGLMKLRAAIEEDIMNPVWHMNYASILFGNGAKEYKSGQELEALDTLREVEQELFKAIELFDKDKDAIMVSQCYFLLGQLFYNVYEDSTRAAELFESAVALYEHPRAQSMLDQIHQP